MFLSSTVSCLWLLFTHNPYMTHQCSMTHVNVVNGSMQTLSESRNGQFQRCLKSAFIEIVFRYTFVRIFLPMQRYKKHWKRCKKILDKCSNLWNFCTFKRLNGSLLCLFVFVYLYKAVFCASTTLRYLPKEHVVTWWFATCWGPLFCYLLRFVVLLFAGFCSFASCWYGKKRAARFHNHAAQNLNNQ